MSEDCLRHVAADSAYIAAANPAAIRALLAELRDLRADLAAEQARADMHADLGRRTAEALGLTDEVGRGHMPEVAKALMKQVDNRSEWLSQAQDEAAKLREHNESLSKCLFQMQEAAKDLARQVEALERPLTDAEIDACIPVADGSAEANAARVEVKPGLWGVEYDNVSAWSLPLLKQVVRAVEAAHIKAAQAAKEK
jgi:hypothetical protein